MWITFTESIAPTVISVLRVFTAAFKGLEKLFNSRIFGGFFSHAIAGFTLVATGVFIYKSAVAGLRLLHIQMGTSAATAAATIAGGYDKATLAALRYNAAVTAANFGGYGNLASAAGAGKLAGLTTNKGGRIINKATGQFVSGAVAATVATGASRVVGGKVVAASATRIALGRIAGLMGGPWGMAIAFVLPGLIGLAVDAMRRSRESTDANTRQVEAENRRKTQEDTKYTRMGHMIEFQDLNAPAMNVVGTSAIGQTQSNLTTETLAKLSEQLSKILSNPAQPLPVNIYIDNELSVKKLIERNQADSLNLLQ
jgi:hypothetical protein